MMTGLKLDGLAGTIALLLPFAALLTVMLLATRRRPPAPDRPAQRDMVAGSSPAAVETLARRQSAPPPAPAVSAPAPAPSTAERRSQLSRELARAEASGSEAELAKLHVAAARLDLLEGKSEPAADHLRKSIRISARLGLKDLHALARLELGDIAREAGDLTTACEHWQIARGLYYDLKQVDPLQTAETRMRQHGCPTDWVLNDF